MNNTITNALDKFSQGALCTWLNRPGASAAVSTLALGAITVPDPVTTAAGLGLLATQAACAFNPNPSPEAGNWEGEFVNVCSCTDRSGYNQVYTFDDTGTRFFWLSLAGAQDFEFRTEIDPNEGRPIYQHFCKGKYCGNTTGDWDFEVSQSNFTPTILIEQQADTSKPCVGSPEKPDPTPPAEPITGESEELGCTLTADLGAWIQSPNGTTVPVIKYSSEGSGLRADGGIISGCNWYGDLIYVGGDGDGPPRVTPFPPDVPWPPEGPGVPDWLQDILSSLAASVAFDQLQKLYATPLPAATYTLIAPCDEFSEGVPKRITVQIPELPTDIALATRIEALIPILQGQKDFKQPLCPPPKPEGEFRTIGFISENYSPNGRNHLRKRLRYRSVSGIGQDALIDHWKDFEFDAGPVTTKHRGASWGTITVWAASAEEGKRVIRHAAAEALVDVDSVGRWEISGSTSARLGMPGRMKINTSGGYFWITERDGSNARPMVGLT